MRIQFEKNAYYRAVTNDKDLNSEFKMLEKAKNKLNFHYGKATRKEFNNDYTVNGWGLRKIICIPAAFYSGAVKSTFHLAQAILIGIVKAPFDNGKYFIAKVYTTAQDFHASYGWLITLFNDRHGQFDVEESEFQQTCYRRHLSKDELVETDDISEREISANDVSEVKAFIKEGDLDSALAAMEDWKTPEKHYSRVKNHAREKGQLVNTIFEQYIKKGELDKATAVIEKYSVKFELLQNLVNEYLTKGEIDNALKAADNAYSPNDRIILKLNIASALPKEEKVKALDILDNLDIGKGKLELRNRIAQVRQKIDPPAPFNPADFTPEAGVLPHYSLNFSYNYNSHNRIHGKKAGDERGTGFTFNHELDAKIKNAENKAAKPENKRIFLNNVRETEKAWYEEDTSI